MPVVAYGANVIRGFRFWVSSHILTLPVLTGTNFTPNYSGCYKGRGSARREILLRFVLGNDTLVYTNYSLAPEGKSNY